jgi:hypothetical protein
MANVSEPRGVPFSRLVRDLGPIIQELVQPPWAQEPPVQAAEICDPTVEPTLHRDSLLLGVGMTVDNLSAEFLARLSGAGVPGVMIKSRSRVTAKTRARLERARVALLVVDTDASWFQVAGLVRERIGIGRLRLGNSDEVEQLPSDLFEIANAVSVLIDAPVTIEDVSFRVLAFSRHQEDTDPAREATVLGQAVPEQYRRMLEEQDVLRRLQATGAPIRVDLGSGLVPRLAVSIRSGGEVLGYMWAAVRGDIGVQRESALAEAAQVVAMAMLRKRTESNAGRKLRADLLISMISGGPDAGEASSRLGLSRRPVRIIGVQLDGDEATRSVAAGPRCADALALHLSSVHPSSAAALLGGTVYGVLPALTGEDGDDGVRRVVEVFMRRMDGMPMKIGIGRCGTTTDEITRSRRDVDRTLRVLASGADSRVVASSDETLLGAMLLHLRDFLRVEEITPLRGGIHGIHQYDRAHQTDLLSTLQVYLEALGDIGVAAKALHIHPNSLRYRLRRLCEIGGLDVGSPDELLSAWLQLRLHALDGSNIGMGGEGDGEAAS